LSVCECRHVRFRPGCHFRGTISYTSFQALGLGGVAVLDTLPLTFPIVKFQIKTMAWFKALPWFAVFMLEPNLDLPQKPSIRGADEVPKSSFFRHGC
jgi:hypothetical protein